MLFYHLSIPSLSLTTTGNLYFIRIELADALTVSIPPLTHPLGITGRLF